MKTVQDLLDFYGVEAGKKYKITGHAYGITSSYVGKEFVVAKKPAYGHWIELNGINYGIDELNYFYYEEVKPEPLTDEERDYLKTIIKPFRDKINFLYKYEIGCCFEGGEVLRINLKSYDYFRLPEQPPNGMFKGMEQDKKYTLEELKL